MLKLLLELRGSGQWSVGRGTVDNVADSGDILDDTGTTPGDINFGNEPLGEGDTGTGEGQLVNSGKLVK